MTGQWIDPTTEPAFAEFEGEEGWIVIQCAPPCVHRPNPPEADSDLDTLPEIRRRVAQALAVFDVRLAPGAKGELSYKVPRGLPPYERLHVGFVKGRQLGKVAFVAFNPPKREMRMRFNKYVWPHFDLYERINTVLHECGHVLQALFQGYSSHDEAWLEYCYDIGCWDCQERTTAEVDELLARIAEEENRKAREETGGQGLPIYAFRIGEKVAFNHPVEGEIVTTIIKKHKKNVDVAAGYRLSPALLRKV